MSQAGKGFSRFFAIGMIKTIHLVRGKPLAPPLPGGTDAVYGRHAGVTNRVEKRGREEGRIAQTLYRSRNPLHGGFHALAQARRPLGRPLDRSRKLSHYP